MRVIALLAGSLLAGSLLAGCSCSRGEASSDKVVNLDETGGRDGEGEYRPSVYDWLPGTTWDCDWVYSRDGTLYRVQHTWQFTETEFWTDCGQRIQDAYEAGAIDSNIVFNAYGWVDPEGNPLRSDGRNPWTGMGKNVILAEFCAYSSTACDGIEHFLYLDGDANMVIETPINSLQVSSLSCTLASRIR